MKRGLNFYEAFFLVLLVAKATQTPFFGSVPSWLEVFSPFFLWALFAVAGLLSSMFGWEDRIKYFFWNAAANKKAGDARKSAEKSMNEFLKNKKSANPGQHYDAN